jgi:hypothetical protein
MSIKEGAVKGLGNYHVKHRPDASDLAFTIWAAIVSTALIIMPVALGIGIDPGAQMLAYPSRQYHGRKTRWPVPRRHGQCLVGPGPAPAQTAAVLLQDTLAAARELVGVLRQSATGPCISSSILRKR